jgi:fructan beta-fructosidase
MPMRHLLALLLLPALAAAADRPDVLVADFEGDSYGDWKATGTAFGDRPARGTLPGQMPVTGYLGKGLVNSFNGGDAATGTLTSPEITIERKFLNFLIGGGKYEGKTCINLLVGGKVVRTATGPNDRPGGNEHLDWHTWDTSEFEGKKAVIQIVDQETGGWGHINVDHIVQSDQKKAAELLTRHLRIEKRYLHLPVRTGAPKRRMKFEVDGRTVREFEIELADDKPDFLTFADLFTFRGQTLKISALLPADSKALDAITASDDLPAKDALYEEKLRPRFHFTSRRGWLNDPNGLVFDGADWHLFYQHNPYGREWGNMHWGHAISPDLVHWKEEGDALYPRAFGDWAFSGSAVLDKENTSGWGTKGKPPLVLAYTSTGRGECIAYSTDRGRTWTEYEKNPVVKHAGRDPKLVWYAPGEYWVMAVYDETGGKRRIAFHTSPDLKAWTYQSAIDDFFECPDLFALRVPGDQRAKWVLYAADGKYLVGSFDGKTFTKESGKHQLWYGNFYAAQTFDNASDGRRVQIGWAQGVTFPGMPFNQQMTVPVDLALVRTAAGVRMTANPVAELNYLLGERHRTEGVRLGPKPTVLADGLDAGMVRVEFAPPVAGEVRFRARGLDLVYERAKERLTCGKLEIPVRPENGKVDLRILIDRGSVEVFANAGTVAASVAHVAPDRDHSVTAAGDGVVLDRVTWSPIKSAWK